jgi:hypothetical protein
LYVSFLTIHGADCKNGGGPIRRHNRIRDFLVDGFKRRGFHIKVEPLDLCLYNARRPTDIQVFSFAGSVTSSWMSVASCFAGKSVKEIGKAADLRAQKKPGNISLILRLWRISASVPSF